MKLASLKARSRDGTLVVVSRAVAASAIAPTLQAALERWEEVEPELRALALRLGSHLAARQDLPPDQHLCARFRHVEPRTLAIAV
jgi:hypothetical protein